MLTVTASNLAGVICASPSTEIIIEQREEPIVCKNKCRAARTLLHARTSTYCRRRVRVSPSRREIIIIVSVCVRVHFDGQASEIIEIYN